MGCFLYPWLQGCTAKCCSRFDSGCRGFLFATRMGGLYLSLLEEGQTVALLPKEEKNKEEVKISIPEIPHLKSRVDQLIEGGQAQIVDINFDTEAYELYYRLTEAPTNGHRIIGKGEAACLALAKTENGIVASNNLRDIRDYVTEFGVRHITTGEIMVNAYHSGLISEEQANEIWANMIAKHRRLGAPSFSEYLESM